MVDVNRPHVKLDCGTTFTFCTILIMESRQRQVCVYCASSRSCDKEYHQAAHRLGAVLAQNGYAIIYGGGGVGSMGAVANGAIEQRGRVIGIIPKFMQELEWGHR